MTREERAKLIEHLKYSRNIGANYTITDEDADEIIKALEQEPKTDGKYVNVVSVIECFFDNKGYYRNQLEILNDILKLPSATPSKTIPIGAYEQVRWERDVAIEQLKSLGYGLGEKPKTGHWIEHNGYWECSECHTERAYGNEYCPDCGSHNGDIAKNHTEKARE